MTRDARRTHPAFAMLLVLAGLVIAVTAAATIARLSATQSTLTASQERGRLAEDLTAEADRLIIDWLGEMSSEVVLADTARQPAVLVAHDEIRAESTIVKLRVTAFDQRGMLPWWLDTAADPLARSVDTEDASAIAHMTTEADGRRVGVLLRTQESNASQGDTAPAIFPLADPTTPAVHGHTTRQPSVNASVRSMPTRASADTALLGAIAIHPSVVQNSVRGREVVLNVSTTPMNVLESALADIDLNAIPQIRAARGAGEQPTLNARFDRGQHAPLRLVNTSDAWAFRVDITIDRERRSLWLVYTTSQVGWRVSQRWVIDA